MNINYDNTNYFKGLDSGSEGISLISKVIEDELSIPCHVLMGANLAGEVAQEMFVEATIGTVLLIFHYIDTKLNP